MLDETRAGFAAAAMSDRAAQAAIRVSGRKGYLDGRDMAEMFAWLRPTDLVWRYWVNNYVQGRKPAPFDVLFWNADTTRMAAALHRDMVLMGLRNALVTPGAVSMLGSPVDLAKVTADAYVVGGVADHISPVASHLSQRTPAGQQGQPLRAVHQRSHRGTGQPARQPEGVVPDRSGRCRRSASSGWTRRRSSLTPGGPTTWRWLAERSGPEVDAPKTLGGEGSPATRSGPGQLCDGEVSDA